MTYRAIPNLILAAAITACTLSAQDASTFIYEAKQVYKTVSGNLLSGAEKMPARDYSFQPTAESPSFSDLISEVTGSQADVCSALQGKHIDMEGPNSNSKADLVAALTKSIRNCAAAYSTINSFNASEQLRFGGVPHSRLGLLYLNITHDSEIYGQLAVYLRLKGLTPPADKARLLPVAAH